MRQGLTLMEERFCQLVALGNSAREAYSEAFSIAITDERRKHSIDNKASRLQKRADIISRIAEAAGENKRKNREMWERRGEEIANGIYAAIYKALDCTTKDGKPCILDRDTLKGVEVLAKLKGLNAPEETILTPGQPENFTPRGVEGMSDADLRAIIEREERTIDVEAKRTDIPESPEIPGNGEKQ